MDLYSHSFDHLVNNQSSLRFDPHYAFAADLYRDGFDSGTLPAPLGYLRNTLTLTLLALLIILPIRGRTDLWLKAWHRRYIKRLKPGRCPHCNYDTTGLTQCPECGNPVEAGGK